MKRFMTLLKIEGKLGFRCPDSIFFGIIMPVGIFFLIAWIAGGKQVQIGNYTFLDSAFSSILTIGICATAFMGLPTVLSDYRDKKILKHFFVTPISPKLLLLAQALLSALTAIISACIITICAIVFFHYRMEGNILLFILAYLVVLFSMYSIGLLISALSPNIKTTNVLCSIVYFPMLFLSGASIPYEIFPSILQKISNILPLTHGIKILKAIAFDTITTQTIYSICFIMILTVISLVLAVKHFRWE